MVRNDFNGDGRSDILWLIGGNSAATTWLADLQGRFATNAALLPLNAMHSLELVATGDFNGDQRTDTIWRVDGDGYVTAITNQAGGLTPFEPNPWFAAVGGWSIVGSGDFNGDGIDDILWRATDGRLGNWLGKRDGSFTINEASIVWVPTDWHISGTGDFNGDGRSDILWTSDGGQIGNWLANADGTFLNNSKESLMEARADEILAIGDFNGNGIDDIMFRGLSNEVYMMEVYQGGAFYPGWGLGFVKTVSSDWDVDAVGDYNGDGTDDLLWRNDNGTFGSWFGIRNDGYHYVVNDGASLYNAPITWQVVDQLSYNGAGLWDY